MQKQLEQLVGLVSYGNGYLTERVPESAIADSMTKYCYGIQFITRSIEGIAGSSRVIASDAIKWFEHIRSHDAKRIRLHYQPSTQTGLPDHISAAFKGGNNGWLVEVVYENISDLYLSGYAPSEGPISDSWKTKYLLLEKNLPHLEEAMPSVNESRSHLAKVLERLSKFAAKFEDTHNWADIFANALQTLLEFEPPADDDLVPSGIYSIEARRLIEAAFRSLVFGGMGSWNDLVFSGQDMEMYRSLTERLYSLVCQAIVSGVNSFP